MSVDCTEGQRFIFLLGQRHCKGLKLSALAGILLCILQLATSTFPGPKLYIRDPSLSRRNMTWQNRTRRLASPGRYSDYWTFIGRVPPSFDNSSARNVTTQLGQTVYLHCLVNNLGDKTVSWIRRRDFQVLTVGLDTYTTDDRFQAIHADGSIDWALQIKYPQLKDAGLFECQVSSDPKISFFVNLNVVVARADILGPPVLYVKTGSAINLTCVISQSPEPPAFVFWYHDDRMINYDSSRAQITVQKANGQTAVSRLYIKDALASDSGNYTCCPSNTDAVSISVYVLNGEKPAAMQHDGNTSRSSCSRQEISFFLVFLLLLCLQHR